jgi:hypothetical protein
VVELVEEEEEEEEEDNATQAHNIFATLNLTIHLFVVERFNHNIGRVMHMYPPWRKSFREVMEFFMKFQETFFFTKKNRQMFVKFHESL